ncbi:class I SAM-dependent methyltransferase [Actinoplanes subtropicus]|uniref:class I SAM-dependent methyltransferase n=1 Tax=Actinoplanes subtropicus TaxID=543632 RepID=UPI0004C2FC5A|nr:class I SAM-dependent methyltransferase [Actinoplanes subtropicus]
MRFEPRVREWYDSYDEDARLWRPGSGDLLRLRTWDIFARLLPPASVVADVGGGPGAHAARLAETGHDVLLIDPMPQHVAAARARGVPAVLGEARALPLPGAAVDVVLLMGPLYHLVEPADRVAALVEARRVLRPGGLLLAEVITRHAGVMDATLRGVLHEEQIWTDLDRIARTGRAQDRARPRPSGFWAYFHDLPELAGELASAGFTGIELLAVEGFAHLLPDLAGRMLDPEPLLRAVRLTEREPSMLGASPHALGVARRPA